MLPRESGAYQPDSSIMLLDHILDLKNQGMTVLFVEHDMHMVRHIADWVVVMAEGKVVAEGPPDAVMKDPAVIDAYLGAHQDVDLGVVTGRYAGELPADAQELVETAQELDQAIAADAERVAEPTEDQK